MKYLPLVLRNLLRRKVRTTFTILSIVVAFLLFGFLMTVRAAFAMGVDLAGADRLMVIHRVSIIQPLPQSYGPKIRATPGVTDLTHANWFGGYYQNPNNFMANMAVDPESWLRMYPEFEMPEEQKKAWIADRAGAVVGIDTAKKFGWKVGDHVPLISPIYRKPDNSPWDFTIRGIYDSSKKGVDKTQFFFQYNYMNEALRAAKVGFADIIGWYVFRVEDPSTADQLAKRVDAMFENSNAETKTATEKAFISEWGKQVGDIGSIMIAITAVVMGFILFVAGNAMAQSIRERTNELAVLKTLGFGDGKILAIVLLESCAIALIGGAIGLGLASLIIAQGDPTGGMLPIYYLPPRDLVFGIALVIVLGLATGLLPAVQASRLKIVDALRRTG
jgi:putative ABC transport system permease protein